MPAKEVGGKERNREGRQDEKERREMDKYAVVIRQTGNAFVALALMAKCHPFRCPVLRVLSSVMFIIPHDGQLDLALSQSTESDREGERNGQKERETEKWRGGGRKYVRLIRSDKLIASTNFARAIELSDDETALSETLN